MAKLIAKIKAMNAIMKFGRKYIGISKFSKKFFFKITHHMV